MRTGNCLVKKFKKPKEDRSNQDIFFSQVDLKLVARVLRMSRITTDQLVWCHAKLSNISFIEGRVHREPSFLLFPCWLRSTVQLYVGELVLFIHLLFPTSLWVHVWSLGRIFNSLEYLCWVVLFWSCHCNGVEIQINTCDHF